jgi:hypothetical protein
VLQSQTLLEGKNGSLYELLIQNDPKSAPPIRVQTETDIKPGTSLLLELDENQQYKPVEKPSNEQLIKLVKLELDFWRAHLLPKTDLRSFPELPSREALLTLANSLPSLKPLVNWLVQTNTAINAQTLGKLIESFAPMASLRPPMSAQATDAQKQTSVNFNVQRSNVPSDNPVASPRTETASNTALLANSLNSRTSGILNIPLIKSFEATQNQTIVDTRLTAPVGTQATSSEIKLEQVLNVINSLRTPIEQTSLGSIPESKIFPVKLELSSQLFRVADAIRSQANSALIHQQTFVRAISTQPIDLQSAIPNQSSPTSQQTQLNAAPTSHNAIQSALPTPLTNTQSQVNLPASGNEQPSSKIQVHSNASITIEPRLARANSTESLQTISAPVISNQSESRIPPELTVGLWLKEVDKYIAQSPPHLHAQLKQKAAELLQQTLNSDTKITHSPLTTASKSTEKEELPLIALRSWLDATQARLQNAAINNAMHQWNFPDTIVQQMQLPLIWLGLTGWADIEWWQEKPNRKDSEKKTAKEKRRWRLRVFLTLDPLAQTCADIDWSNDMTNITFWSEDTATLAHLNQLLPTLDTWTQGLGEKSLTTKHGMPKKASESNQTSNSEHHLVDIRT